MSDSEFDRVRGLTDPVRQAVEATELMGIYQQRSIELARLRRAAIDQVASSKDQNFTELAASLGLSKGRISQIRKTAPPLHRDALGIGPLKLISVRKRGASKVEGVLTLPSLRKVLEHDYRFTVRQSYFPHLDVSWRPSSDSIVVLDHETPPDSFDWLKVNLGIIASRDASAAEFELSTKDGARITPPDSSWCFVDRRILDTWVVTVIVVPSAESLEMAVHWIAGESLASIPMSEDNFQVVLTPSTVQQVHSPWNDHPVDIFYEPRTKETDAE